jgi:hypothetical protein
LVIPPHISIDGEGGDACTTPVLHTFRTSMPLTPPDKLWWQIN